jgi:phosphate starvation-inducible PhoH-like protein
MARRPQQGQRSFEYTPKPKGWKKGQADANPPEDSSPSKGRKDRQGPPQAFASKPASPTPKPTSPLARTKFDTSYIVPYFRTTMNAYQESAWDLMGDRRITMLLGPAGTAKTHCAIARAMHELIVSQSIGRVVLVRPAVEAGERIGFLPGDLTMKLDPYFRPVYDIIDDLVGWKGPLREQVNAHLEIAPVGFMRGRTFKDAIVILDEAQNCTWQQLKMVMTRLGRGSRMVITGDADQSDLPHHGRNPLSRLHDNIRRKKLDAGPLMGCQTFPAKAIVRDEAVVAVLSAFDDGMGDDDWPVDPKKTRRAA